MELNFAVRNKLLHETRRLVEGGVDVNAADPEGITPLMLCCLENNERWSTGVARMLLQARAKVGCKDKQGRNSLMLSVLFRRYSLTKLFLQALDFRLDASDSLGNTALHYSVMGGNNDVSTLMLDAHSRRDIPVKMRNRFGHTAASLAMVLGQHKIVNRMKFDFHCEKQDFELKIPKDTLLHPWKEDFELIENPRLLRQQTVREINEKARVHLSRPLHNTHQFRRAFKVTVRRQTSCGKVALNGESASETRTSSRLDSGWRRYLPGYLITQKEQQSQSYRSSAKPLQQSYDEVFDFVATEENESEETGSEESTQTPFAASTTANGAKGKAAGMQRNRSKSSVYDSFALVSNVGEGRRRSRRESLHNPVNNHHQASPLRRKTLHRLFQDAAARSLQQPAGKAK